MLGFLLFATIKWSGENSMWIKSNNLNISLVQNRIQWMERKCFLMKYKCIIAPSINATTPHLALFVSCFVAYWMVRNGFQHHFLSIRHSTTNWKKTNTIRIASARRRLRTMSWCNSGPTTRIWCRCRLWFRKSLKYILLSLYVWLFRWWCRCWWWLQKQQN